MERANPKRTSPDEVPIHVFDESLHKANTWIRDILRESGWDNPNLAYSALRATLHTLRDRLTPMEALNFASELPMTIRGLFFEGWRIIGKPDKSIKTEWDFLDRVKNHFRADFRVDPLEITYVIFSVISRRIPSGEISHVRLSLPGKIRQLWPDPRDKERSTRVLMT